MQSLPSRRFGRFGISLSAGRSASSSVAEAGGGGADTTVSASQSTVTSNPATVSTNGSDTATITVTLYNASGTPLAGKAVTLSATGSNNTIVQPDVTDSNGETTGTIASTTAEAKTITAVSEGVTITDTATVTATDAPTLAFFSDWSTATGTGLSAKSDGSKWTTVLDDSNGLNVVAVTTEGLPTTNYLAVTAMEDDFGTQRLAASGLGTLADGASRWVRVYFRCDQPFLSDDDQHPIESGQTGGFAWVWNTFVEADDGTYRWALQSTGASALFWQQYWQSPPLTIGTWYRFEMQFERVTSTTFRYHARVYDLDGLLLYSDADFLNKYGSNGVSAGQYSLADETILPVGNMAMVDETRAGLNGLGGSDWYPSVLWGGQAGYAVSDEMWCGPYIPGNG